MFLMNNVFYMKRKAKGAISVFLILIFVATYVLTAALVDGGRYRMAKVVAESALDSASQSVLSYYNQMLYDLYGLMAVDAESISEEQIANVLEDYVSKTLMTVEIEDDAYVSTLTQFLLDGEIWSDDGVEYFDDYAFTVTIGGESAGSSVTLASMDYVEDQIVDYMKYRAPMELAGIDGFLGKLNAITAMEESLNASQTLVDVTKSHRDLFREADALKKDVDSFIREVAGFCQTEGGSLPENESDFQNRIHEIDSMTAADVPTEEDGVTLEPEEVARRRQEAQDALEEEKRTKFREAKNGLINSDLADLFSQAQSLRERAGALLARIDTVYGKYKDYIEQLRALSNGSDEYKAVFEPEAAAIESQCGEMLRGIIPLLAAQGLLGKLESEDKAGLQSEFDSKDPGTPDEIISAASGFFANAQERLTELLEEIEFFEEHHAEPEDSKKVDADNVDISSEPEADEEEKKTDPTGFDKPEDLVVAYTQADTSAIEDLLSDLNLDTGDNGKVDQTHLFNAGLNLVKSLTLILGEGMRDDIYTNEYVMTTFPNIVADRDFDEGSATKLQSARHKYNATNAGVEYILVGKDDAEDNVKGVKARLLGTRTIFNTVAIFTDAAKRNQAAAIASAIPCPLTPVLTVVILIGWAVAESAIDVVELMNGEEVPLFKTGGEWTLSIEGAISKCVDMAVDAGTKVLEDTFEGLMAGLRSNLETCANQVIYDVYSGAYSSVESAIGAVRGKVEDLADKATAAAAETGEQSGAALLRQVNTAFHSAAGELEGQVMERVAEWGGNYRDQAIKLVGDSLDQAFDEISSSVNFSAWGKEAKAQIKGKIGDHLNVSEIVGDKADVDLSGSGKAFLNMSYEDYLRVFLLLMNQDTKIQRIQSLVQANMNYGDRQSGGDGGFRMKDCAVAVWADMDCEIRYLFMTHAILPDSLKRQGHMTFTVHSAASY